MLSTIFLLLISSLASFPSSPSSLRTDIKDASLEEARATLVQLIQFSDKQALRTEQAQKLMTGEMTQLDITTFGKLTIAPDKMLMLEKNRAIGRVQRFGENNQVTDVYFYLQYESSWKSDYYH